MRSALQRAQPVQRIAERDRLKKNLRSVAQIRRSVRKHALDGVRERPQSGNRSQGD